MFFVDKIFLFDKLRDILSPNFKFNFREIREK